MYDYYSLQYCQDVWHWTQWSIATVGVWFSIIERICYDKANAVCQNHEDNVLLLAGAILSLFFCITGSEHNACRRLSIKILPRQLYFYLSHTCRYHTAVCILFHKRVYIVRTFICAFVYLLSYCSAYSIFVWVSDFVYWIIVLPVIMKYRSKAIN